MPTINRINKRLQARFGARVQAEKSGDSVLLSGTLDNWEDIVRAGQMARGTHRFAGVINDIALAGVEIPPMRTPPFSDASLEGARPDVLIIGAGVTGCAIARALAAYRLNILLLDKEHDVGLHASSRNDGMVHPGIDLKLGQIKRKYCLRGCRMFPAVCRALDVPFARTGQYLCFHERKLFLPALFAVLWWNAIGVRAVLTSKRALQEAEPHLADSIAFAVRFPDAGTVCPYGLTIALAENAVDNGVQLSLDAAVLGMTVENGQILSVKTNRGTVYPRLVVNAAGVFADTVAEMAGDRFFSIHPRRGTNTILDKKAAGQVHSIASSFGTSAVKKAHTKGGGIVHTIDGNLLVGPDAHETYLREDFSTEEASLRDTFLRQKGTLPSLSVRDAITYFTGVRAATYEEDFIIGQGRATKNLIHAAGIQSPGLTACPAIAEDVAALAVRLLGGVDAIAINEAYDPTRRGIVSVRQLSGEARDARIRENPDYGVIVCRCEEISRGEILDALRRSVPCDTVDGVKRRVRPGMGRCQGAFCSPQIVSLIAAEKRIPVEQVTKSGPGSELLLCRDKEASEP